LDHHVSVVLCCYAFVVAERIGAFSPLDSTAGSRRLARDRGLNATLRTLSSRYDSRLRARWSIGFRAARSVTELRFVSICVTAPFAMVNEPK
jgi:hypothetical protein